MTAHNKGKRYIACPSCERKRYCSFSLLPNNYKKTTCSKGHEWETKLSTLERINDISRNQLMKTFHELMERNNTFYRTTKR